MATDDDSMGYYFIELLFLRRQEYPICRVSGELLLVKPFRVTFKKIDYYRI